MASMRAENFLYLNNSRILGEDLVPTCKMHLSPPPPPPSPVANAAVRSKAVVLLLLTFCLLVLLIRESVIVLCFVIRYFMSILVLQSS